MVSRRNEEERERRERRRGGRREKRRWKLKEKERERNDEFKISIRFTSKSTNHINSSHLMMYVHHYLLSSSYFIIYFVGKRLLLDVDRAIMQPIELLLAADYVSLSSSPPFPLIRSSP